MKQLRTLCLVVLMISALAACTKGGEGNPPLVGEGPSGISGAVGGTVPAVAVPLAPGQVTVTAGNAQVALQWDAVTDATSYNIYWKNAAGVTGSDNKISGAANPYNHTGLTNGSTYFYAVTAVNSAGESPLSSEVSAKPLTPATDVPQNLSATAGIESVSLKWGSVVGATSYNLYWSNAAGVNKGNGTQITGVTSPYQHLKLTGGATYYYVVTAIGEGGEGVESAQVSAIAGYPVLKAFITSATGKGKLQGWAIVDPLTKVPWSPAKSGIDAGDEICQHLADAAGLAGTFKAWLSDHDNDAYCRVHNLAGKKSLNCGQSGKLAVAGPWLRTDGVPFGDTLDNMLDPGYKVYSPLWYDENGKQAGQYSYAFTDTDANGVLAMDNPCDNWKNEAAAGNILLGGPSGTGAAWSSGAQGPSCSDSMRLFCLQTVTGSALAPFAQTGKKAFITSKVFTGNLGSQPEANGKTGLAAGDEICNTIATAAGLGNAGKFKAWLSDDITSTNAIDRFTTKDPWVRLDGIRIANTKAELASGNLRAPINLTEKNEYLSSMMVWTGTKKDGTNFSTRTCNGWTVGDNSANGEQGQAEKANSIWTENFNPICSNVQALYCLEDD